jgi:hypothetical protein
VQGLGRCHLRPASESQRVKMVSLEICMLLLYKCDGHVVIVCMCHLINVFVICCAISSFLSFRLGMYYVPFSLVHVGACFSLGASA